MPLGWKLRPTSRPWEEDRFLERPRILKHVGNSYVRKYLVACVSHIGKEEEDSTKHRAPAYVFDIGGDPEPG